MTFQPGAVVNTQGFGNRPESVEVPFVTTRAPTSNDTIYPIGKRWVHVDNAEYVLLSQTSVLGYLQSSWGLLGTDTGALNTLTGDSGGPISPVAGNINILGGSNITVTGAGDTLTIDVTGIGAGTLDTLSGNTGTATPILANIQVAGNITQGLSFTGTPGLLSGTISNADESQKGVLTISTTAQINTGTDNTTAVSPAKLNAKLGPQTNHGVILGTGGNTTLAATAEGATNTVLIGHTGANPTFSAVPNAALAGGGAITINTLGSLTGGGSVSLGGTITLTGTGNQGTVTQFDVLVGEAGGNIASVGPGTAGQVLQSGGNAAPPAYSTATYPSTSGAAGKIIQSSGSNYVTSTITFPLTWALNTVAYASPANLVQTTNSANNAVLVTSNTGQPSFQTTIPLTTQLNITNVGTVTIGSINNSALTNSSVTLVAGTGTTIMNANPLSLGGSATIALSSSYPFFPNSIIQIYDDFLVDNYLGTQLNWFQQNIGYPTVSNRPTNPGLLVPNAKGSGVNCILGYSKQGSTTGGFTTGNGQININWVFQIPPLSTSGSRYRVLCGLNRSFEDPLDLTRCIYFSYTDNVNSGKWQIACANTLSTINDSGVLATRTGFHNFGIEILADGSSVSFFIDGVETSNSPITTNIPVSNLVPWFTIQDNRYIATDSTVASVDLMYFVMNLTAPR